MEKHNKLKNGAYLEKVRYNVRTRLKRRRFLHAYCPKCSAYLLKDKNVHLTAITEDDKEESLELSLYLNIYEPEKMHTVVRYPGAGLKDLKCPHCNQSIVHPEVLCGVCGSPTAELSVASVNYQVPFFFCLKKGCSWDGISPDDELRLIQDSSREW